MQRLARCIAGRRRRQPGGECPPEKVCIGGIGMTTEYLLDEQVQRILGLLTPSNRLVMRVSLHTGLRVEDVLELKPEQLRLQFWVTERKTGKRKRVGLPAQLLKELRCEAGREWVFPGRLDARRHRTRQAVWADVKRAAKAYRLPQNVAPHSFRKVYAVKLLEKYGDMKRVQKALNHRSANTTRIYAMADAELEKRARCRRWS